MKQPGPPATAETCTCLCHKRGYKVTHVDPCCRDVVDPEDALARNYSQPEDVLPSTGRRPRVTNLVPLGYEMRKDTPRE